MGKRKFISLAFAAFFIFSLASSAEAFGYLSAPGLKELIREKISGRLTQMCERQIEIHEQFPRFFRVPRICQEINQEETKPPTLEFYTDNSIINEGESTNLQWNSDNTLSCEAGGGWAGVKDLSGEEFVSPVETTEYSLTCYGAEGEITETVVIGVIPTPDPDLEGVVINEIAWMGSIVDDSANANAEWIELRNLGTESVNLLGWTLTAQDGTPDILISESCANTIIPASGFFLLVRTNDSVLGVIADCAYTGALGNTGEVLDLKNDVAEISDTINGIPDWQIGGEPTKGDNTTKDTAQRAEDGSWFTSPPTPKASNSI